MPDLYVLEFVAQNKSETLVLDRLLPVPFPDSVVEIGPSASRRSYLVVGNGKYTYSEDGRQLVIEIPVIPC